MKKVVYWSPMVLVLTFCSSERGTQTPPQEIGMKPLTYFDDRVSHLLSQMTLDEKVGQMTQADQQFLQEEGDIASYFLGSLLSGGDSDPETNSLEDWTEMYERIQARSLNTRLKIPLLYGVDAVHGHNNVVGAVIFPHNIGLGATRNAELVEKVSRITAEEIRATGINWAFAPCVAVPRDERWGRAYEGFSEDPILVSGLGRAAVRGLQGLDLRSPLSVLACAKHYIGDGGTVYGTGRLRRSEDSDEFWPLDRGDAQIDEDTLRRIHLPGYITAIQAGVGTIMPSYSSWNGEKCSGSRRLLTEILKEELGFEGFLISDYNAIDELPGDYRSDVRQSINAGMDMVMVPSNYRVFFETLRELVESGEVPMSRVDDAVRRILRVKFAMGLLDAGWSPVADRSLHKSFGSEEHREVARDAVRQSLVLLKNDHGTLPLSRSLKRIHLAGKSADDLGNQCGGWTITWQGGSGPTTVGTTILEAVRETVAPGTEVKYSLNGSGAGGSDVALAVIGETPYAEMNGDRHDLALDREDLEVIQELKRAGVPVVVVLISGRPLMVQEALEMSDAFVVAWLPGTEGRGVTDVLFGDYMLTGKLPFSWPRSMKTLPVNIGDADYDPLYPYGFGLSYGSSPGTRLEQ